MSKTNYYRDEHVDGSSSSMRAMTETVRGRTPLHWRRIITMLALIGLMVPTGLTAAGWTQNIGFDICLQDDATGDTLRISSATGQYRYTRCSDGRTLAGLGEVTNAVV